LVQSSGLRGPFGYGNTTILISRIPSGSVRTSRCNRTRR
jgi:hypothetical protein